MQTARQTSWRALLVGIALIAAPDLSNAQPGPSSDALLNAGSDSSNWVLPAGDYSGNRQIKESEISPENVGQMQVGWTFNIPENGPIETTPIVLDGMVYITSNRDDIYALDVQTGELKWQYNPKPTQIVGFPRNRGCAILNGTLYIAMINGHLAAVDAKTGKELWNKQTVADPTNSFYTMQPVPYKGKILLGVSNGDWGGIGNISAFDPKTGERIWKWETIPGPGQPGHDSWSGKSWKRGCGAIWSGVGIDPSSDTLYINVGNPCPDFLGATRKGDNLYTDSMVALDISGSQPKMKWYHQFIPHDTHDWDPSMPPVLFTGKVDGKDTKVVAAGDKAGNFWMLNAENGDLISNTPVSYQMNSRRIRRRTGITTLARTPAAALNSMAAPTIRPPTRSSCRAQTSAASGRRRRSRTTSPGSSTLEAHFRVWPDGIPAGLTPSMSIPASRAGAIIWTFQPMAARW